MTRKRFFRSATVVALLAAPPAAHGQAPTSGTVRESESGTRFPVVMTPPGATTSHRLMGTGIREATLFKVNVYAFGLYVDAAGARAALAAFTGRQAAVLLRDARFNRRLLDLDFGMALRLVMTRTVDGGDVADAFDDALRPRMGREGSALARLRRYLGVDAVRRGTEVVLACDAAGRMTIRVGEAERATLRIAGSLPCVVRRLPGGGSDLARRPARHSRGVRRVGGRRQAVGESRLYLRRTSFTAYTRLTVPVFS